MIDLLPPALILLDITMPRMDGFEAHAAMHAIRPDVPVSGLPRVAIIIDDIGYDVSELRKVPQSWQEG